MTLSLATCTQVNLAWAKDGLLRRPLNPANFFAQKSDDGFQPLGANPVQPLRIGSWPKETFAVSNRIPANAALPNYISLQSGHWYFP
ncbi:MAG: hypothetical protein WCK83_09715, partial [Burkholderiales bacterium]